MSAYLPMKQPWRVNTPLAASRGISVLRWLAIASFGLLILFLAAFGFSRTGRTVELEHLPVTGPVTARGVTVDQSHGYVTVRGEAVNTTKSTVKGQEAVVELFDASGSLLAVECALVMMPEIARGTESPFVVQTPDPGMVRSFRIRFRSVGNIPSQ